MDCAFYRPLKECNSVKNVKLPGNCKGVTMIILTLAMTVILSCAALVFDIGGVMAERQKMQSAVDASALAAALELPDTEKAGETALHYAELNGMDPEDITVTFSDNGRKIDVMANKTVGFIFAKIIGIDSADISTVAAAEMDAIGGAFNYALFSGSTTAGLYLNGSDNYIDGSTHSNKSFTSNGSDLTITGACESCSTVTTNGSRISIGSRAPNSASVEMPDFSETLKQQAENTGKVYSGNKTFNGSGQNVDEPIYVEGNVYVNGGGFTGKGCILATGDIIFNGSNLQASSDDAVCFYSKSGNIYVNGASADIKGILYAPKGNIIMNGSNQTVHGRVIGNVTIFNGSQVSVIGGTTELASLPSYGIRLVK
jgi:Flp pilus assembly protein TadG